MNSDIWARCPKSGDVEKVEQEVRDFLNNHGLDREFTVESLEFRLYHCTPSQQEELFNELLSKIKGGNLALLKQFDLLFRQKLAAHVPQKGLGGMSPVKYALFLKKMSDGKL